MNRRVGLKECEMRLLIPMLFGFVFGALIQTSELFTLRWFAEMAFFVACWLTALFIGEQNVECVECD